MMTCKTCDDRLKRTLTEAEAAHESAQDLIGEITGKRYFAEYEAGNFKRQMWRKSGNFKTLTEAIEFVLSGIGSLQGQGQVMKGGEVVWEFADEAEAEYRAIMMQFETV